MIFSRSGFDDNFELFLRQNRTKPDSQKQFTLRISKGHVAKLKKLAGHEKVKEGLLLRGLVECALDALCDTPKQAVPAGEGADDDRFKRMEERLSALERALDADVELRQPQAEVVQVDCLKVAPAISAEEYHHVDSCQNLRLVAGQVSADVIVDDDGVEEQRALGGGNGQSEERLEHSNHVGNAEVAQGMMDSGQKQFVVEGKQGVDALDINADLSPADRYRRK